MDKMIVIAGPTGVGKTALSVSLAKKLGGEIISADSMQLYRGMDIGTAKVTENEKEGVPHHLIDIIDPTENYSLASYLPAAKAAAADITSRGHIPFLVGGTGLYISSFVDNIRLLDEAQSDLSYREELKEYALNHGNAALKELLRAVDPESYERLSENDTKRIIRALEIYRTTGKTIGEQNLLSHSLPPDYDYLIIGLTCRDRAVLYERINRRVDKMIEDGLTEEVRRLNLDSCGTTARQAIGYKQINSFLKGECTIEEAAENIKLESRRYAKRQLTWFRRMNEIHWEYTDEMSLEKISKKYADMFMNGSH